MYNKGGRIYLVVNLGDIYYANLIGIGSEQKGIRPVLVVQNNLGNKYSPTTIVIPITSKTEKLNLPTHILLKYTYGLKYESVVLVEQIRTIDKTRLLDKITTINSKDLIRVKKAVKQNLNIRGSNIF